MSNIKPFWLEQRVYYKPKAMQSAAVASAAHVHQHTSVRFIIMMMCLRVYSFVRCSGLGHLDREMMIHGRTIMNFFFLEIRRKRQDFRLSWSSVDRASFEPHTEITQNQ